MTVARLCKCPGHTNEAEIWVGEVHGAPWYRMKVVEGHLGDWSCLPVSHHSCTDDGLLQGCRYQYFRSHAYKLLFEGCRRPLLQLFGLCIPVRSLATEWPAIRSALSTPDASVLTLLWVECVLESF